MEILGRKQNIKISQGWIYSEASLNKFSFSFFEHEGADWVRGPKAACAVGADTAGPAAGRASGHFVLRRLSGRFCFGFNCLYRAGKASAERL